MRFLPGEWNGATYVLRRAAVSPSHPDTTHRITHDMFLPVWKSNVSVTLMIDKKAKRYSRSPEIC